MSGAVGIAVRAATMRSFVRGILGLRLIAALLTAPLVLADPRPRDVVLVLAVIAALAGPLVLWERVNDRLVQGPAFIAADVALSMAVVASLGPSSPFVVVTLGAAALAGLLYGSRGAIVSCVLLVAAYTAGVAWQSLGAASPDLPPALVGQPLLYPLLAVSGAGVGRVLEYCHVTERRLADMVSCATASDERARLAREMHDSLGKTLHGIALAASGLARSAGRNGQAEAARAAGALAQAAQQATSEARAIIGGLRADQIDAPFADVVARLVEAWSSSSGVVADLDVEAVQVRHPGRRYEVLAVLSEALRNVDRHADASRVLVRLRPDGQRVRLEVGDDGCGFACPSDGALAEAGHFGVVGMRERAALIGARLHLESQVGRGTIVVLSFQADSFTTTDLLAAAAP